MQRERFDNSLTDYSEPWGIQVWLDALAAGDPRAEELAPDVRQAMREAALQNDRGSMFGIVASMGNMTQAFEELLRFLPKDFVWPTILNVTPFSVYAEWGRDDTTESMEKAVWIIADSSSVRMNADFRPGWPECGASDFDARIAAGWLQELTQYWEWQVTQNDKGTTGWVLTKVRPPRE